MADDFWVNTEPMTTWTYSSDAVAHDVRKLGDGFKDRLSAFGNPFGTDQGGTAAAEQYHKSLNNFLDSVSLLGDTVTSMGDGVRAMVQQYELTEDANADAAKVLSVSVSGPDHQPSVHGPTDTSSVNTNVNNGGRHKH